MFEVDPNRLNLLYMVPDITDYDPDPESLEVADMESGSGNNLTPFPVKDVEVDY